MAIVILLLLGIFCALAVIAWRQIAGEKSFNHKWFNIRHASSEFAVLASNKADAFLPRVKKGTARASQWSAFIGIPCGLFGFAVSGIDPYGDYWLIFGVPAIIALWVFVFSSIAFVLAALVHSGLTYWNSYTTNKGRNTHVDGKHGT